VRAFAHSPVPSAMRYCTCAIDRIHSGASTKADRPAGLDACKPQRQ
jgi:hypothetical protein